jgi:SPASM domain peptide maturase of grasp-with-spasm system
MLYKKYSHNTYFLLYASVQLVKGARRTLLIDLERNKMQFLPNDLYHFVEKCKSKVLVDVVGSYDNDDQVTATEYVDFLVENEFGFHTDEPERFPTLELTWKSPSNITNAVVDINRSSNHDYKFIVDALNSTRCQAIDFRVFESLDYDELENILKATDDSTLQSVRLYIPYAMWNDEDGKTLFVKYPRLNTLVIHGASANRIVDGRDGLGVIIYLVGKIDSPHCCGYVSEKLMLGNLSVFTEAMHYNSCLNRKLSIDSKGFVKNCSLQNKDYGHYKDICFLTLAKENEEFSKEWNLNKDSIDICNICEFRYCCIDCRYIIADESNKLSKPKRCHYDPYTATWGKASSSR